MTERQPPEVQMVNALLSANYPDETEKLLTKMRDIADDRIIAVMSQFADQLSQQDRTELAAKLTKIMVQARKILPKYDPAQDGGGGVDAQGGRPVLHHRPNHPSQSSRLRDDKCHKAATEVELLDFLWAIAQQQC